MNKYVVIPEDEGEIEGRVYSAESPQEAAESFADWRDSYADDFTIVNGESLRVIVRDESGREFKMIVQGQMIRRYAARVIVEDAQK